MFGKIFLHLLIICGIWSQGITGTFADEEINKSSDSLARQKRVVSYLPGEDIPLKITAAPYVIRIREITRIDCIGSILSSNVVITLAICALLRPENYEVLAANARISDGHLHDVTQIKMRMEDSRRGNSDGIALLTVTPHFVYSQYCQPIRLHIGPVLVGSFGKVHGWGYNFRNEVHRGTNIPKILRSIEVPIISHQNCIQRYQPHIVISEKTVCTYHPQRHNGHIDFGAPLVVDGYLAGVFLWSGLIGKTDPQYPDVYAYLQDNHYNQWIRSNL